MKIFQILERKFWSFPKPSKQASAMSMSELTLFFSKEINRKFGTIWIKCHILAAAIAPDSCELARFYFFYYYIFDFKKDGKKLLHNNMEMILTKG